MLPLPFDAKTFAAIYGGVTITKYQANFIVFAQGDAADCVFYIQQGKVKLSVVSEQGKEAVIAVLETGDLCGEGCLAVQPLRISTATTMTDCVMVRLEKASVVRAMHDNHAFCDFLMAYLLNSERASERCPDRSLVQFEREAAGTRAFAVGQLWERSTTRAGHTEDRPTDIGEDDRHDPGPRQPFHEQVSQNGIHRIQRRNSRP